MLILLFSIKSYSQKKITDKGMTHQQERMVYKQWDKNKFTPSKKILGIQVHPLWYTVWGLHPNYRKKDHRPLSDTGPQTVRLGLTSSLVTTSNQYKLESDTMRVTALKEFATQSHLIPYEPLWELYYKKELKDLVNLTPQSLVDGLDNKTKLYLVESKLLEHTYNKFNELNERLEGGKKSNMDRGNRILFYHRIMLEYRGLDKWWQRTRIHAPRQMLAKKQIEAQKDTEGNFQWSPDRDKEIAKEVVRGFRYLN